MIPADILSRARASLPFALVILPACAASAAGLIATDDDYNDKFGYSVSVFGSDVVVGAFWDDIGRTNTGGAYYFSEPGRLTSADPSYQSGSYTETHRLMASDMLENYEFGKSVCLYEDDLLIGAPVADGKRTASGAAYYYRNLSTFTSSDANYNSTYGAYTESIKLIAWWGDSYEYFGCSSALYEDNALVGAFGAHNGTTGAGVAYYFKDIDTFSTSSANYDSAEGAYTQTLTLYSSDGAINEHFAYSVSLSGDNALAGADGDDGVATDSGSAYYFRGLDSVSSSSCTETLKLIASDGIASAYFGKSVSISGDDALVGASLKSGAGNYSGGAYYYKDMDTFSTSGDNYTAGGYTESFQLIASDGAESDRFGCAVSLSGDNALVGANNSSAHGDHNGCVYIYTGISSYSASSPNHTANGYTQSLTVWAADASSSASFGCSVSMWEGDTFAIGASGGNSGSGKAYYGTISSMTTLDSFGKTETIDGLCFASSNDWIIGGSRDRNQLTLSEGCSAEILDGHVVRIGRDAGSDDNVLFVKGSVSTSDVFIGASGNDGNALVISSGASTSGIENVHVASGNSLYVFGAYTADGDLATYLSGNGTLLYYAYDEFEALVTSDNLENYFSIGSVAGYSYFTAKTAVPEPATYALFGGLGALALAMWRRRGSR